MTRRPILAAASIGLLALACVNNAGPPGGRPAAAAPALDSRLRSLGAGIIELPLDPGQVRDLDPINMALNLGLTPPPCADFVMVFTWQVRTPEPAGAASVRFSGERMGGVFDVGTPGAAGEASIGCALLEAINDGTAPVVVEMRFVVATSR